jgi:GAF domain-containing protein
MAFLLAVGLALAVGAALLLRAADERSAREAAAPERALRQARDQQAATAEILGAMAASPPDLQRVLDTIARNAVRVCDGSLATVARFDGQLIHLAAHHAVSSGALEVLHRQFPCPPDDTSLAGRAIRGSELVHVIDVGRDPRMSEPARDSARALSYKSAVVLPLLQGGRALGALSVARLEGDFSERQIQLLQAFAAQAVIAIENVRLFQELEARNNQLTQALEEQTATAEILRVIGESPADAQPVFDRIVESAVRLCEGRSGSLYRLENGTVHQVAYVNPDPAAHAAYRAAYPRPLDQLAPAQQRHFTAGRADHIPDTEIATDLTEDFRARARVSGYRSVVAVPMLREGGVIGSLAVARAGPDLTPRPFSDREIRLLETFTDQAVIALENVRLFTELQARNRELIEALEQQTATAEILKVISSSPTDTQPVFDTIVENVARLCDGPFTTAFRFDGEFIYPVAYQRDLGSAAQEVHERLYPRVPSGDSVVARAIRDRAVVHVRDIETDVGVPAATRELAQTAGYRSILAVPMLREGHPIGALGIGRGERHGGARPFSDREIALVRTFADQAVIAIENVRLFTELEARNRELTEALEQQTATAEILRVISTSPTSLEPVLDAVVKSAARFCGAPDASVFRLDGKALRAVAHHGPVSQPTGFLVPAVLGSVAGRSLLERRAVSVTDLQVETKEFPEGSALARQTGQRATLSVPLLREAMPIGAILLRRAEAIPFTDKQIALLKTFADQAVIAIENVRLFTELEARNRELTESLEQQTATAEILGVISRSPTDLQPVLDAVARSASRLCGAANVSLYRVEGSLMRKVAEEGPPLTTLRVGDTRPITRRSVSGRTVVDRMTIQLADYQSAESAREYPDVRRDTGIRTTIGIPLLREGIAIGAFTAYRTESRPFSEREIALLQTFADQAVIAIENVRLFQELQARNRDLTEALEQQTATAEILGVISRSPTDLQPVLDAVARNASRLCGAANVSLYRVEGNLMRKVAEEGPSLTTLRVGDTRPITRATISGQVIIDRKTIHVPDYQSAAAAREYPDVRRDTGIRTMIGIPLLREETAIGVFTAYRTESRPFSEPETTLLQTFADQAVIAIENVRLFTELQARNRELTESLEQQTATSEILRAISSSPTDTQPVFETIAQRAFRVCDGSHCTVFQFDGTLIHLVAHYGQSAGALEVFRQAYPLPLDADTMAARSIREGAVVHNPDLLTDTSEAVRRTSRAGGYRTGVIVPMLRSGRAVGAIGVGRSGPGGATRPYTEKEIALLQTFADQGVIAVENVRLFRELEARTRELARSVEELQALSEVGRAVSSTLDLPTVLATIVARAVQLSGTSSGVLYEYDETTQTFHLRASHQTEAEVVEALRASPIQLGEGATGRAGTQRAPVEVVDILDDQQFRTGLRAVLARLGYRSILSIPFLVEQRILGALTVSRREPGHFPPETVNLLQTFATQSALAIQNARLFREIEAKGRELEVASRHKSQFLANMSHELRTPLNAILGYTELLIDGIYGDLSPKAGDVMARIDRSGKHLLGLINDVLDLSKIEAGQLELALADYSLAEVVHAVVTQVESLAAEKGLILQATVAPDLPAGRGDERRLAQVLLNLVGNALKFTEVGSVRIVAHRDGDAFVVAVADTGPGIAEADRQRIFEEFQQADSSSTRKKGGTGLGLSIARRIVELHGGRIGVESTVGRGSVFSFRVPVRVERQAARA